MENRSSNRRLRVTQGGLAIRFALLLLGILVVAVGVYAAWSNADQQSASEQKVLEEARLLSQQMAASWNYVDSVQDSINYNSDGRYDFKGVYCSVAGKSIALRFTQKTDCIIRYTRENPRTGSDAPDSFEAEALAAFKKGETERYEIGEYEGEQVFRYASAIPIVYGCLQCHGTPEGELDETGYPKEGMQIGDIAGAVSIIIPMQQYQEEAAARTNANVMLFMALAVLIVAATSCGLYWWVTRPLGKLALAAQEVGSGRFDSMMSEVKGIGEIKALSSEFAAMERSLKSFYEQLEDQVSNRTEQLVVANEALAAQRDEISRINEQLTQANALLKRENEFQSAFWPQ